MKHRIAFIILLSALLCYSAFAESAAQSRENIPISAARPEYSFEARQRHLAGAGIFVLNIRPNGTVASVRVVKSTGQQILDRATIAAFRKWLFPPGRARVVTKPIIYTTSGVRY